MISGNLIIIDMDDNVKDNVDKVDKKDKKEKTTTSIYETLDIIFDGEASTKRGARFATNGTIISQDNNLPEVDDESVLDTISQALLSAKDAIGDCDIVEGVSKVASEVVSGIGEIISSIDL